MAVRPGEENVATLFGDVHYFYCDPAANPPHHRFDKGSYVYLFENANDRRARIEIANQPGTDNQDAFDGFLDHTLVGYSYKRQCLVSIVVDGVPGSPADQGQWHLPTYDPHNQNKYHYRLHSLDVYFWTQADALLFVNGIRRVLPASQVEVADEPPPPPAAHHPYGHSQDVNPLVQKLERAAVSDPAYSSPKPASASASQNGGAPTFAPPPAPGANGASPHQQQQQQQPPPQQQQQQPPPQQQQQQPATFAPMAYNPAAPAAPEQVRHREKTPPPPEDDGQNPLAAALARDHGAAPPFSPGYAPHPHQNFASSTTPAAPGLPGPPTSQPPQHPGAGVASPGFPPSQYAHLQRANTMPVSPGVASPGFVQSPYAANFSGSPGFAPPPPPGPPPPQQQPQPQPQQQQPQQQQTQTQAPPPSLQSSGLAPPPGGFAQFSYAAANPNPNPAAGSEYSIHQQVYRPTEVEAANSKYDDGKLRAGSSDGKPSRLDQNAKKLEKGVTGMLKRFEKKFS